ncbi:MAG TPA: Hpt domain-containing protein [Pseudobdellovibrionaceae bacterium]|nr:Hpt domain-containing protein [Pseudobdellovibrionaceae bacterium]
MTSNPSPLILNLDELEKRFLKDPDFLEEVVALYQITCKEEFTELRMALASSDVDKMRKSIHKLKGSTINYTRSYLAEDLIAKESEFKKTGHIQINSYEIDQLEAKTQNLILELNRIIQLWKC